jgi:diazepam-binding inhibitor (GABA receptor modulating acyl-CoA-binding protein)
MNQEFTRAVERVNKLPYTPDNDVLLELYGLYKQVTVGDNHTDKPSWFDMKANAKWQAWMKMYGMPSVVAMGKYVALANSL